MPFVTVPIVNPAPVSHDVTAASWALEAPNLD
jgi:hypothetical protein